MTADAGQREHYDKARLDTPGATQNNRSHVSGAGASVIALRPKQSRPNDRPRSEAYPARMRDYVRLRKAYLRFWKAAGLGAASST